MSPSVVLVLKLVSRTHVKPVTGIVVSDDGRVLVPADFVATESGLSAAEIVVLDGGTDILSHGRPAKIIKRSMPGGLALLAVDGLERPGIVLSESALDEDTGLHLAAFPPAEYIAKGAEPLWVPVKVVLDTVSRKVSVSPATPLPYISGPIIDDCGFLAGLSLASGAQSLEAGKIPATIFAGELSRILGSIEIKLPGASCGNPATADSQQENDLAVEDAGKDDTAPLSGETEPPMFKPPVVKTPAIETPEPDVQEAITDTHQDAVVDPGSLTRTIAAEPPSLWRQIPLWLPPLGIIIFAVLIWKGLLFFRLTKNEAGSIPSSRSADNNQAASGEPDTAQLQAASDASAGKPRSAPVESLEVPDMNDLPPACNGMVIIEGTAGGDTRFKRFCAVNTGQFDIVIGRGAADINIEHPAISRTHARLECDAESMTLSDLGSSNGTFIKGVPCLPGEVFFVAAEDEIILGEVELRISVITNKADMT